MLFLDEPVRQNGLQHLHTTSLWRGVPLAGLQMRSGLFEPGFRVTTPTPKCWVDMLQRLCFEARPAHVI